MVAVLTYNDQLNSLAVVKVLLLLLLSSYGLSNGSDVIVDSTLSWNTGTWCPPPLPVIPNSNLTLTRMEEHGHMITDYSPPGATLFIACDDGYRIDAFSNSVLVCQTGRWTSTSSISGSTSNVDDIRLPECQVWCQRPTVPHGNIENTDDEFPPGMKVELQCDEGYRLANKFVYAFQCGLEDGKWTGHNGEFTRESPHCVPATCPPLPITPNSILEYRGTTGWDGGFQTDTRVSYACRQGFRLTFEDGGAAVDRDFECRNGIWQNLVQATCELVGCGPPPSILDGEVVGGDSTGFNEPNEVAGAGYPVGVRIGYRCNPGFELVGSLKRYRCSSKGHWMPSRLPTCRNPEKDELQRKSRSNCPAPPTISRARLENATAGSYPPNSAVFYVCDEGFVLEGSPNLICDQSGHWQPQPGPTCRPNVILPEDCLKPGPPPKTNDLAINVVAEGGRHSSQLVPVLVGTLVSAVLLAVLLAVQLTKKGGWKYLSGWTSASVPMCRNASDDVIVRGGNADSDRRPECSASSLLYCEPDRVALLNGTRGHPQVLPPTYEEAIQESGGAGGCVGVCGPHQPHMSNRSRCYRFASLRSGFATPASNDGLNPTTRHSAISTWQSGCGRSSSVADSLNSTDTVTPSEVSTTVTVDTLSSNASSHPTSSISTRAFCGSLASFDTTESDSALNMEGVPLLEETEIEQGISPSSEIRTVLET